jgi:hypothetical protein
LTQTVIRSVATGQHGKHARDATYFGGIDGHDLRVSVR